MWHKIIEGDEKEYPKKSHYVIVSNDGGIGIDCVIGKDKYGFIEWESFSDVQEWHEIPTDEKCVWKEYQGTHYKTSCDIDEVRFLEMDEFREGYKVCPYCGRRIKRYEFE